MGAREALEPFRELAGEASGDLAAAAGHHDIVALLLHNNADPNARDAAGRTALALADAAGHAAVADLLRRSGAR